MSARCSQPVLKYRVLVDGMMLEVSCDPKRSGAWLLKQADDQFVQNSILQGLETINHLGELFNRTKNSVVNLNAAIELCIDPSDVLEARYSLSSLPTHSSDTYGDCDGLFVQQLHAFQFIGKQLGPTKSSNRKAEQQAHLVDLLKAYMQISTRVPEGNRIEQEIVTAPVDLQEIDTTPAARQLESVFEIVFTKKSIGMKLGSDQSKKYAVVKECFEGSEAIRYPEIEPGIVILAVNGEEVGGIGLSRTLARLRAAERPVVVRFGKPPNRFSTTYADNM